MHLVLWIGVLWFSSLVLLVWLGLDGPVTSIVALAISVVFLGWMVNRRRSKT